MSRDLSENGPSMARRGPDENVFEEEQAGFRKGLGPRQLQMIAIGGAIGTGLFMGSGKTISVAGPSVILVYMVIGFMLYFVMRAMGELLLSRTGHLELLGHPSVAVCLKRWLAPGRA